MIKTKSKRWFLPEYFEIVEFEKHSDWLIEIFFMENDRKNRERFEEKSENFGEMKRKQEIW